MTLSAAESLRILEKAGSFKTALMIFGAMASAEEKSEDNVMDGSKALDKPTLNVADAGDDLRTKTNLVWDEQNRRTVTVDQACIQLLKGGQP